MLKGDLYKVIDIKGDDKQSYDITIRIVKDHELFEGHFPGNPILPGACQLEILKELLGDLLKRKVRLESSSNMKFISLISPVEHPDIRIRLEMEENGNQILIRAQSSFPDGSANFKFKGTFVHL